MDQVSALATQYAQSVVNRSADPNITAELAAFSRTAENFAARIGYVKAPSNASGFGFAPAPGQSNSPVASRSSGTMITPPLQKPAFPPD